MLLCDSVIAGYFIGKTGVAAINAVAPVTGIVTFFGDLCSTGVGIAFAREMGAMKKKRADEIYGQGLIISLSIGLLSALILFLTRDAYFSMNGVTGEIRDLALQYYALTPINALMTIFLFYLEQMVYSDGDELCNNICYVFQIGGNIVCSFILANFMGMTGIILGSIIGNCTRHFFRKGNTLHFVWHLSLRDFLMTSRYSIVDSSVYLCWALMDYVLIGFVSQNYGDSGLIVLAVVVNMIEFAVVLDGVGMAMQPLIGTYFGEKNPRLIKRVMKSGTKAAVIQGLAATALILIFTRQFCALFGITGGAELEPAMFAVRIVSIGFTFVSLVSLMTSYYMLIDRVGMAVCFACLQNGILYMAMPMLGTLLFGMNGMWIGFAAASVLTLIIAMVYVFLRFGKDNFPYILKNMESEIIVLDGRLTPDSAGELAGQVKDTLLSHGFEKEEALRAALFAEEIGLTVIEQNRQSKKPVLIELSLFFEDDSVFIIERDSGKLFDMTDPDLPVKGLSSMMLSELMDAQKEKAYLVTTGYNRNMIRFRRGERAAAGAE